MKTLYDLLGALPDDDSERLRAAFRKAAKANHPDRNPGDPDAPRRFRRIVRANAILNDERQRATYDHLLEIALRQRGLKPGRGIFLKKALRPAVEMMAGAALSVGLLGGGYLLLEPAPKAPLVRVPAVEMSAPVQTALVLSTGPSDTVGRASSHDKLDQIAASGKLENPESPKEVAAPSAPSEDPAGVTSSPSTPPAPTSGTSDVQFYRERGISAYRSGDLYLALVDFDLAISVDPNASELYIDRAIVYHRIGDLKRAFADVSQARRIDDSNRRKAAPATAGPP
jgi:curved DNA-binding protein CbpA